MRYRYYFSSEYDEKLECLLKEWKVKYKLDHGWISFSLWSSSNGKTSEETLFLINTLKQMHIFGPIMYVTYTARELASAKLLEMHSKKQKIDIVSLRESYSFSCEYSNVFGVKKVGHLYPKAEFRIKKEPPMDTKTAFWHESIGFDEIFADYRVKELVENYDLKGIEFENVFLKNGICSRNLYRMKSQHVINKKNIVLGYGEKIERCPVCGQEKIDLQRINQLHLNFNDIELDSDLYETERIFGPGIPGPIYLISQRFYKLLLENNLSSGLVFSPVIDIKNDL